MYIGHEIEEAPLDMSKFDVANAAKVANEHLKTISDYRRRQILINFRDHALAECNGDHEALMATCSKKQQRYAVYNSPEMNSSQPHAYEELVSYYKILIDTNMYLIHTEVEKLIVGTDALYVEGIIYQIVPGAIAREFFGILEAETDAIYQCYTRSGITFVFDEDGKGCGEHAFSSAPLTFERMKKLEKSEIPAQFFSGPKKVSQWFEENPEQEWPAE